MKPTEQMNAVGIGGVVAIVAMGLVDQVAPGNVDWSASTLGVPLGAAIVFLGTYVAGWLKGGPK